jgi:hypothetical protein
MADSKTYKYFDRVDFILACRQSVKRGFNRQIKLTPAEEAGIPDKLYPVLMAIQHEHIAGKPADPHVRVMIGLCESGGTAMLDVDMEIFNSLSEVEVNE